MKKILTLFLLTSVYSCSAANINNMDVEKVSLLNFKKEKLVYMTNIKGIFDIFSIYSDGTAKKQITFGSEGTVDEQYESASPSLSADKNKIVFLTNRDKTQEIYSMDADGINQKKLTGHEGWFAQPSWSNDGKKIIYTIDQPEPGKEAYIESDVITNIYIMDADGSNKINITKNNDKTLEFASPRISPDNTKIVFSSYVSSPDDNVSIAPIDELPALYTPASNIYLMNLDGTNKVKLTSIISREPRWSPDGREILFISSYRGANDKIYTIDSNGNNQKEIKTKVPSWSFCSWGADGVSIAYTADPAFGNGIRVFNLKNNEDNQIVDDKNSVFPSFN
jgi:Tol biopolymer transport system component